MHKDGKKESFLILTKNIVEIKKLLAKGFDAGDSDAGDALKSEKLEMSIK